MASPEAVRSRLLDRLGLVAIAAAALDLVVFRAAAGGRDGYVALLGWAGDGTLGVVVGFVAEALGLGLVAAIGLHAVLGLAALRREPGAGAYLDRDRRRLQGILGVFLVPFVGLRLAYGPLAGAIRELDAFGMHQAMRDDFATLPFILVQTLGAPALALHALEGLSARARRMSRPRVIPFVVALAAVYVVVYLDSLASFAVGRAFLPRF